jgi:hypothetical protein
MQTMATTRAGFRSHIVPTIPIHPLPLFTLSGVDLSRAVQTSPEKGLDSISDSQSGFIGKEFAVLVAKTLD